MLLYNSRGGNRDAADMHACPLTHLHKADDLDAVGLHDEVAVVKEPLPQQAVVVCLHSQDAGGCGCCDRPRQHRDGPGKCCRADVLKQECTCMPDLVA